MTKTQIFNAVYGIFEDNVDEVVVEGHVSKLRKKLRMRLGHDVIDARRYLGYQFVGADARGTAAERVKHWESIAPEVSAPELAAV